MQKNHAIKQFNRCPALINIIFLIVLINNNNTDWV